MTYARFPINMQRRSKTGAMEMEKSITRAHVERVERNECTDIFRCLISLGILSFID